MAIEKFYPKHNSGAENLYRCFLPPINFEWEVSLSIFLILGDSSIFHIFYLPFSFFPCSLCGTTPKKIHGNFLKKYLIAMSNVSNSGYSLVKYYQITWFVIYSKIMAKNRNKVKYKSCYKNSNVSHKRSILSIITIWWKHVFVGQ